ncbi:extracellular solute-binding protein [Candidatus Eisenbacteria bacterium]|uniref:Extracellular solute-binding protein n=1 Tax=Eiseniibacteriota bacterium TaxID=2212470 RepID=A0ABV6YKN4_UNCEI
MRARSSVLLVSVVGVFLLSSLGCGSERETPEEIVVLSYGGEFATAQRAAFFDPFQVKTGIRIVDASYGGEYGRLKAAVESGNVPWDVVDVEASALLRGIRDELFLPIDYSIVDSTDLVPEVVTRFGVGTDIYSVSMGYNTNAFPPGADAPGNWQDFWNTERFPGPRCMKKDPRFTLEIALLADGVPLDEVYAGGTLDVDRAFRSLDRIKDDIAVWWTSGQQPIQLLADGEVVMAAAFGARLFNAQFRDERPVAMNWAGGVLDVEYWTVLRGSKNVQAALQFIDFASQAEQQAELPRHLPLGPVNKRAFEHIPEELARRLNTHPINLERQVFLDADYWADHESDILERFNQWLGE